MQKLKNIGLLRFLLTILIILNHLKFGILSQNMNQFSQYLFSYVDKYWISVDLFFIISGFFLFLTTNFEQNFLSFLKKKLLRFMPPVLFILILSTIFSKNFLDFYIPPAEFITTIFCLQGLGIVYENGPLGQMWFISSLLAASCFYFYLYKIIDKKIFNFIVGCILFFGYTFYFNAKNNANFDIYFHILSSGTIRAIIGVGLGYVLSVIYKKNIDNLKNKTFNFTGKIATTIAEIYLPIYLFSYITFRNIESTPFQKTKLVMVTLFVLIFLLFVFKKGYLSKFFENDFCYNLGKYSYSIYVTNQFVIHLWKEFITLRHYNFVVDHTILTILLFLSVVILFGIFTYHFIEEPIKKFFTARI